MRYDEVIRRYLSVRESSSREWSVGPGVIMCVEIDMSADTYVRMSVASSSSQRRRGPQFLRVTVFRFNPNATEDPETRGIHGIDISQIDRPDLGSGSGMFTPDQRAIIQDLRGAINRWVKGDLDALPPSTSDVITKRLQGSSP